MCFESTKLICAEFVLVVEFEWKLSELDLSDKLCEFSVKFDFSYIWVLTDVMIDIAYLWWYDTIWIVLDRFKGLGILPQCFGKLPQNIFQKYLIWEFDLTSCLRMIYNDVIKIFEWCWKRNKNDSERFSFIRNVFELFIEFFELWLEIESEVMNMLFWIFKE